MNVQTLGFAYPRAVSLPCLAGWGTPTLPAAREVRSQALKLVLVHSGEEDAGLRGSHGCRSFTPKCDRVTERGTGIVLRPTSWTLYNLTEEDCKTGRRERRPTTAGENLGSPPCLAFPLGVRTAKVGEGSRAPQGCRA